MSTRCVANSFILREILRYRLKTRMRCQMKGYLVQNLVVVVEDSDSLWFLYSEHYYFKVSSVQSK